MINFQLLESNDLLNLTAHRAGEKKLGETLIPGASVAKEGWESSTAPFVIFGVPESIGPQANLGFNGAENAWNAFMKKFVNLQANSFLNGASVILYGAFDFSEFKFETDLEAQRNAVEKIDEQVSSLVTSIVKAGKIPILIGGGHNNCYGLLKGSAEALGSALNCINLDPHADFRKLEGRHSGNGFSYAKQEGYLDHYAILALHEGYNSEEMLARMKLEEVIYQSYEAIFLREERSFSEAFNLCLGKVKEQTFGVELDLDSIAYFPTSAKTPSGISLLEARKYAHLLGKEQNSSYFHIAEGAPALGSEEENMVGKSIAYLVADFIKAKTSLWKTS